jgi:tRNA 2-selenouridine synthase SelU
MSSDVIPTIIQFNKHDKNALLEALDKAINFERAEENKSSQYNQNYIRFHRNKRLELEHFRDVLTRYDGIEFV